jgi:putative ABC transport system permease protein
VRISRWEAPPTVIGVMEHGVRFLPSPGVAKKPNYDVNATVDFWVPADPNPKYLKEPDWNVVARLRDRTTPQQGQTELAVLAAREGQTDKEFEGFTPRLEPITDEMNRDGRRILLPLLGAAVLVLLIEASAHPLSNCGWKRWSVSLNIHRVPLSQHCRIHCGLSLGRENTFVAFRI